MSLLADKNSTTLRSLYYPPVNSETAKEGQLRCGEHSDYGSITLLFQSSEGLQVKSLTSPLHDVRQTPEHVIYLKYVILQVRRRSGEFISAPSIPGAILVNIADLMQRWTSDQFVSVVSREEVLQKCLTSEKLCWIQLLLLQEHKKYFYIAYSSLCVSKRSFFVLQKTSASKSSP